MLFDALNSMILTGSETVTTSGIDWSSVITSSSFDGMLDGISTVLPVVVPVGLTITGIFVVWRLVKKMAKG